MNFNPFITVLVQKKQDRTYYPVAVGEAGLYLHLHQPYDNQPEIRTIFSGSCQHGGSLIGIAWTPDGRRDYSLTDKNQPLPEACISEVIESAAIHPDELVYLYSQKVLMGLYKQFHTADKPLKFKYQSLFSNYLLNLLPLFWQEKMTAAAFVQAAQLLLNRERMMAKAMCDIATSHGYVFEQSSSLNALGFAKWLDEEPDSFLANLLKFFKVENYKENNYTIAQLEEIAAARIIDCLSTEKAINAQHLLVWKFIKSNLADIQTKRELSGLALINILDYCAQFAVSQLENPTTMVAVQSRESPLLEAYNAHFSSQFAAVVELLWIDPFQLYSEESHHMMYHLKKDLGTFNALIKSNFDDLASMVAAIAIDDGSGYLHAMRAATTRLGLFANKQPSDTTEAFVPGRPARPS